MDIDYLSILLILMRLFCFCRKNYCCKNVYLVQPRVQENVDTVAQHSDGKKNKRMTVQLA